MNTEQPEAIEIFFSYAHEDELLCKKLETHLSSLKRQGLIANWHDRMIIAGTEWEREIDAHLNTSQIILLLISADFTASDYCNGVELRGAMERHYNGEARVLPIILRPCDWKGTPFEKLQVLPKNGKPITSWPQPDDAFVNVVEGIRTVLEEIRKQSTIRLSSTYPIDNLPYERNVLFTGRQDILEQLYHALNTSKNAALTQAISGLGGIGKTQTAIEYAYRYQNDYDFILWVKADSYETLLTDMVAIAHLLDLPQKQESDQTLIVNAVKHWLQEHDRWLLIFDNADDLSMVKEFLPQHGKGHTILTTRTQITGRVAQRIEIERMSPEEGALFLLHRLTILALEQHLADAPQHDRTKAEEIVRLVDGLPLALDQAGAYIDETRCGLAGYLQLYKTRNAELLKRRGKLVHDHPDPVATTWSLAFEKVQHANAAAADLLRLCAFLDPDMIPEEILLRGGTELGQSLQSLAHNPIKLNEAIAELLTYSLISRNPNQTLTIHRLVQTVLQQEMSKRTQQRWTERVVRAMNISFPEVTHETQQQCLMYLPHAQKSADLITYWNMNFAEAAALLMQIGDYLRMVAQYTQAEPLFQRALAIREQVLGPQHPETATTLDNLAGLYQAQGKYDEAEPLFQRALAIYEQVLGPQHPETAITLNNLALLYRAQGKYNEAEPLFQRALAIREQVLGPQHPSTATTLDNLAGLYQAQGKYDEAEPLFQRALAIREQVLGPQHPETATTLNNLALLYRAQGKYDEAEPLFQRALAIYEQVLGPQHPSTAITLNNLAGLYRAQGKYNEAEPLFQRALAIREQVLGPQHPETATTLNNLALLYQDQGKYNEAEPLFQRALAIYEQGLGPQHPSTAITLNNLAGLYQAQGKYNEAEPLFQRALAIYEQGLGPQLLEDSI